MINILKKYELTYYNEIGAGSKHPHHPSSNSGVTIGCGYDLKHRTKRQAQIDLEASIKDEEIIKRLVKAVGLSGAEATQFCKDNSDIEINDNQQISLFHVLSKVYEVKAIKDYEAMFKSAPPYHDLPSEIKDLIFDFTYNLGSIKTFPRFFNALLSGDRKGSYANYKRYTGGVPLGRRNTDTKKVLDNIMFKNYLG